MRPTRYTSTGWPGTPAIYFPHDARTVPLAELLAKPAPEWLD